MISNGVDNAGLLLLMYPRPVFVAAAVLDFFPIEGPEIVPRSTEVLRAVWTCGSDCHGRGLSRSSIFQREPGKSVWHFWITSTDCPRRGDEQPQEDLDSSTVQCTRTGQVMLDFQDAKPLTEVVRGYFIEQGPAVQPLRRLYFGEGYPGIRSWKLAKFEGAAPANLDYCLGKRRQHQLQRHCYRSVCCSPQSRMILPLLHIHKAGGHSSRWQLWLGKDGKAMANDWPEISTQSMPGMTSSHSIFAAWAKLACPTKLCRKMIRRFASLDLDHAYVNPLSSVLAGYVYNSVLMAGLTSYR